MARCLGNDATAKTVIGKRPGEKLHEVLVSREERERTFRVGKFMVMLPMISIPRLNERYAQASMQPVEFDEFSSATARRLDHEEIEAMLRRERWLDPGILPTDNAVPFEALANPFSTEGWSRHR
jgi:FlaA1/EpsC-like NDP-sugar epimerase